MTTRDPRPGYKTSKRAYILDGPPGSINSQREHWDGRIDARVGGIYLDDDAEESEDFKKWLGGWHEKMRAVKSEMMGCKAARDADPSNEAARLAFQAQKQKLMRMRAQFKQMDPRRYVRTGGGR